MRPAWRRRAAGATTASRGQRVSHHASEAEAEQARRDRLAHNRTPLERVEGDTSFWTGTPEQIAATIIDYRRVGFHTFMVELAAPYDVETMESVITVVKPMVERVPIPA